MVDVNRDSFFRRIDIYAEVGCSDCNPIKSDATRCKSSFGDEVTHRRICLFAGEISSISDRPSGFTGTSPNLGEGEKRLYMGFEKRP